MTKLTKQLEKFERKKENKRASILLPRTKEEILTEIRFQIKETLNNQIKSLQKKLTSVSQELTVMNDSYQSLSRRKGIQVQNQILSSRDSISNISKTTLNKSYLEGEDINKELQTMLETPLIVKEISKVFLSATPNENAEKNAISWLKELQSLTSTNPSKASENLNKVLLKLKHLSTSIQDHYFSTILEKLEGLKVFYETLLDSQSPSNTSPVKKEKNVKRRNIPTVELKITYEAISEKEITRQETEHEIKSLTEKLNALEDESFDMLTLPLTIQNFMGLYKFSPEGNQRLSELYA